MRVWVSALLCAGVCLSLNAQAFVGSRTSSGVQIKWPGSPYYGLAGNPSNRSAISEDYFFRMVTRALQRWKQATGGFFQFDFWQGNDRNIFETNRNYNGVSNIYFTSSTGQRLDPEILGLTQVWYDTQTGQILEADIELNDSNHFFAISEQAGGVFIDDVVTHEIGHALGLSHAGGLQSTMLYVHAPEQSRLSCDERTGIRSIYDLTGGTGSITGQVHSPSGSALFGAQVVAISRIRGTALASAMTDASGGFTIRGLEAGEYFLYVEPYYPGGTALSEYYQSSSPRVCSGRNFARSFLTVNTSADLRTITVHADQTVSAGTIFTQCGTGASVVMDGGTNPSTAPVIDLSNGLGRVGRLSGEVAYYRLHSVVGNLKVHALSYSLYSPMQVQLRLLDSFGNELSAEILNPVFEGASGYVNRDSSLEAGSLAPGSYILEVTSTPLSAGAFPAALSLDSTAFLVLTGGINDPDPARLDLYPNNARCEGQDAMESYQSPGGTPPRASTTRGNKESVGFCGTIRKDGDPPGTPPAGQLVGWLIPWLLMVLAGLHFSRNVVTLRV